MYVYKCLSKSQFSFNTLHGSDTICAGCCYNIESNEKVVQIQIKTDYLCHICQCNAIDPPYCFPNLVLSSPNADERRLPGLHEILAMIDIYVVHNTLPALPYISICTMYTRVVPKKKFMTTWGK